MARFKLAGDIINAAASECGLTAVADPFASSDPAFVQLVSICTTAGQELLGLHDWQKMTKEHSFVTTTAVEANLPDDFGYMIDQTQWDRTAGFPLGGPLSPQNWAYREGSLVGDSTIYVCFRIQEGVMKMLPDPMTAGKTIAFEYISRNWVLAVDGTTYKDEVTAADDTVLYESIVMIKFLKLRFLEAKGFDTTAATDQFGNVFMQWTGRDISAPVLNMAGRRGYPYLGHRNIPETGYGS